MIDVIFQLAFVNCLVDLFTNSLHSAVSAKLSQNEPVVLALAKLHVLVNLVRSVGNNVVKTERSKLLPGFFDSSDGNSSLIIFLFFDDTVPVKPLEVLLLPLTMFSVNAPVMQLLIEVIFHVLVLKLGEHFPVVSQVVNQGFECLTISIEENFVINDL